VSIGGDLEELSEDCFWAVQFGKLKNQETDKLIWHYGQDNDYLSGKDRHKDNPELVSSCLRHNVQYPPCELQSLLSCCKLGV